MDIFDEAGIDVIPLFDAKKHPEWPGYNKDRPLMRARTYMEQRRDKGMPVQLTGRYALLRGYGIVLDPEGRKWNGIKAKEVAWMRATLAAADVLPSWVSAGGDGGQGIRNVFVPIDYVEACRDLGIESATGASHRVPLGSEGKGELLLKFGVCVPKSRVGEKIVDWSTPPSLLAEVEETVGMIWPSLAGVLATAIVDAKDAKIESGLDAGDEPIVKSVAQALSRQGADAGVVATKAALSSGASRHYLVKTWANWAFIVFGSQEWLHGDAGVEELVKRIYGAWAKDADFTEAEVLKAVRDERRYCAAWVK